MNLESSYTIILALGAALAGGLVGGFALMRRMSLAGDAVSHIALPGLAAALLLNINPLLGALITLLLGALLIWRLEVRTRLDAEVVVGVVFSASLALGGLITPRDDLIEALYGGFRQPSDLEFASAAALTIAILVGLYRWKDGFVINLFSSELAVSIGLNRDRLNLVFSIIFAMTVLLVLRFLGALLAGALIVIPAAVAQQWTSRLYPFFTISAIVSLASVTVGGAIAAERHLSLGPAVVIVAAVAFLISVPFGRLRLGNRRTD
jgi:ABC-type Mn2+/Zn2+ transport system permease subunit